ncbi:MAG: acyl-CoA dehydrogenase family protein [Solirubrobacterales bacterium]
MSRTNVADRLLSPEDIAARDWARGVMDGIVVDECDWEESASFPWLQMRQLGDAGVLGLTLPTSVGGASATRLRSVVVHEQIARRSLTLAEGAQIALNGPPFALSKCADRTLWERLLPAIVRGESTMAIAITEEQAGSDLGATATSFRATDDEIIVDGTKCFVTAGALSASFLVLGRFHSSGLDGLGYVLVEADRPGVAVGNTWAKMGANAVPEAAVRFEDVAVPAANVVIGPMPSREGFKAAMRTYNAMRLGIAALCLGAGQTLLETIVGHAQKREQFGRPIAEFQGLQWRIARLATRLEQARLLTYAAAAASDGDGFPDAVAAAHAKLAATEVAIELAHEAMQVQGWRGMVRDQDHPTELMYRQLRGWSIAGGTTESLLNSIAADTLRAMGS